jgi:hypothetical protein
MNRLLSATIVFCLRQTCFLWLLAGCVYSAFADDANTPVNQQAVIAIPAPPEVEISYVSDSTNVEPTYQGLPIAQWIEMKTPLNPNRLSLAKLLSLKEVSGADQWGQVGFEVPVNYVELTNNSMGWQITVGFFNKNGDFDEGCFTEPERATNGHCLIWWDINYDPPGKHDVRARLTYGNGMDSIQVIGPPLSFYSSNVCRFFEGYSLFDSSGATLLAKLREPTATYRIELTTPKGSRLKVITGSTTNGLINTNWDLTDRRGRKFKDDSFDGFFYVTYPDDKSSNAPAGDRFNKIGSQP